MTKFYSRGALIAALTLLASIAICAAITAAHASAGSPRHSARGATAGWDVEAFGGRQWSGNISAGGEGAPEKTITLERVGEYTFGGGFGYNTGNGWRYGGRIRYGSSGCDEGASIGCTLAFPGEEVETRQLSMLATVEYTLNTALIVDPFLGVEAGLGLIAFDCEGRDACPAGTDGNANHMDYGFMYGFCGGLRLPLTDDHRWILTAAACHHRTEGVNPDGVPHWDAPSETTAELRVGWRL